MIFPLLRSIVLVVALAAFDVAHVCAAEPAMRVTLLGTGTPAPSVERFGYATLVEAGGQRLL